MLLNIAGGIVICIFIYHLCSIRRQIHVYSQVRTNSECPCARQMDPSMPPMTLPPSLQPVKLQFITSYLFNTAAFITVYPFESIQYLFISCYNAL